MQKCCFYKEMLSRGDLSVGARVLWSWLVSEAVECCDGGIGGLEGWLTDHSNVIKLEGVGYASMPDEVGLSRSTFQRRVAELRDAGVFVEGALYCSVEMLRGGYFELKRDSRFASVEERVLYSWLVDRCEWSGASIIWVSNQYISKVLGLSVAMVRKYKTRMFSNGLLEVYHPRRGSYYTAVPALYKKYGHKVREYDNKVKRVKVRFDEGSVTDADIMRVNPPF